MNRAAPADAVAVIGCGWAGISAAVELVRAGVAPIVFDAAPAPGGRARAVPVRLGGTGIELDNGQHLLLGAYRDSLRLIDTVRGAAAPALRRAPLRLESTDGMRLVPWRLPAPLHLAFGLAAARGIPVSHRIALVRLLLGLRGAGWRVRQDETVAAMLSRLRQPPGLRERLWDPLVVAALNTASHEACAQTFANVLRDSLGASREASDFVLAEPDLSRLLATPARHWLEAHGAELHLRTMVRGLRADGPRWLIDTSRGEFAARAVVLAVPPFAVARLLEGAAAAAHGATLAALDAFRYDSIATVYLAWAPGEAVTLPRWVMLQERPDSEGWGQWLFDRGERSGMRVAAVVVSARGRLAEVEPDRLATGIARQVATQLATPPPADARTVVEKRATFRCTPGRPRIRPNAFIATELAAGRGDSPFARLALAGDFAHPDYPATLESAVRSGREAARLIAR